MAKPDLLNQTIDNAEIYSKDTDRQSEKCSYHQRRTQQSRGRLRVECGDNITARKRQDRPGHTTTRARPPGPLLEPAWVEQNPKVKMDAFEVPQQAEERKDRQRDA